MEKICNASKEYVHGLISRTEFLIKVAGAVMGMDDNQAMAFAIIMGGEEEENE